MAVGGQRYATGRITKRMIMYQLYRKLGGAQGRSGQVRKISPHNGIRSPDLVACTESMCRLSYPGTKLRPVTAGIYC
jgi:hypothetical protein